MYRRILALLLACLTPTCVYAGKLHGTISSTEELKESQSAAVIWVEGLKAAL